jgi:hypothetical protein
LGSDTGILRQEISKLSVVNIDKEEQENIIHKEIVNLVDSNYSFQKEIFAMHIQALQQGKFTDPKEATMLIQGGRDYLTRGDSQGLSRINSQLRNISSEERGGSNDSPMSWLTGLK